MRTHGNWECPSMYHSVIVGFHTAQIKGFRSFLIVIIMFINCQWHSAPFAVLGPCISIAYMGSGITVRRTLP